MKSEIEKIVDALDKLNLEKKRISTSRAYKLSNKILVFKHYLKCFDIKGLWNVAKKNINEKKISKKRKQYEIIPEKIENKNFGIVRNKKIVVYTCITGNYDIPCTPIFCPDNVTYILFTNSEKKAEGWINKPIPEKINKLNDNILINRYIKLNPHEIFKNDDYDYSIYIDGNIRTMSDISGFINMINENVGIAMFKHHTRKCIYMEEKVLNIYGKGNKEKLECQVQKYRKDGFPENFGMLEGNVIVSDLKSINSMKILNEWWKEFKDSESLRDQISLPYELWK